jgi:histidinol dehydrogenase
LELAVRDPDALLPSIRHAGAIFMGHASSESLGVYDFQKRSSVIAISDAGAQSLGPVAATLARGEGLDAHAKSAQYRLRR